MGTQTDPRKVILSALEDEERVLSHELERLREGLRDSLRETSGEMTVENHPGDVGTETYEREKDLGRARYLEAQVAEVVAARHRLAAGEFGVCQACGRRIDPGRLAVRPQSALCLECEERNEGGARGWAPEETHR
ncbi:MAG: TraR/DksA C4-type zinc finger protein [Bacillota bacterium]|nr:TraR/DksA C4-type zinc finger protein [Bacillota bacterium]